MRRLHFILFIVLIIAGTAMAVSCGATVTSTALPAAIPSGTAMTTPPSNSAAGGSAVVVIENFAYSPPTLTVPVGTTVTWTNKDSVGHTVTTRTSLFDSGLLSKGQTFSYTFNQKGTYDYYCTVHPYMAGKIIVE
jgi:amicyanin